MNVCYQNPMGIPALKLTEDFNQISSGEVYIIIGYFSIFLLTKPNNYD